VKIATWNVNSIRSRLDRLLAWLQRTQPDVACLQELKATDEAFPYEPIQQAGYHATVFGQKTYNGVAILSRAEPANMQRGMSGFDDPAARFLTAEIDGTWIASIYVPNGQVVGSEKYAYKLRWMRRLREHLESQFQPLDRVVLCGDFNAARDELDVAHPAQWANGVLFHEEVREHLEHLLAWGLVDVLRKHHPDGGVYSWWDYRMLAFPKNDGLRLDYILATEPLASRCTGSGIDREERKGEKPSDHAPVVATFKR
jgi:exodeoxyribonuclease III